MKAQWEEGPTLRLTRLDYLIINNMKKQRPQTAINRVNYKQSQASIQASFPAPELE